MIIAKITQNDLELTMQEINVPYQHSQGLEIEFIRDQKYKDYTLLSFYKLEGNVEAKLTEINNDIISITKDVFKQIGKVSFSFSLTKDKEVIHLGVVGFYVRRAFGDNDSILPQEDKNTWMDLISNVAKDGINNYWDIFYKEEIENIVNDINSKVSAASNYASQANLAKTETQKSAADASNSASNALTNANKAKEHLDNVNSKVNAFNADYTNKVNSFNSNAENANNTLDAKIEKANTDIDKKITDTNNVLDKKIVDANGVIDAKVTEATKQADVATTKATKLSDAVDKVNYLEDALDTKLTQPYVSSDVIENATISDSDEGLLRNLKIYGKCTQKVETGIVPTPSRPVPITSKKINVGSETVELRSLKESVNLFDLGLLSKTELIPNVGAYRKIDIPLILKPNTQYTFSYDPWEVPALSWVVLNITNADADADGRVLAGIFNINNTSTEPRVINKNKHLFTTDSTGQICFSYYANGGDNPYVNLWFTKLLKNIMLVEGTTIPSTYVPPTTRDYKIVDHVNKKSWIERNVIQKNLADLNPQKIEHSKFIVTYVYTTKPAGKESSWNNIFCNNFAIYPYNGFPTDIKEGIHVSQYGIYVVLDDKRNVTTIEEYKEWIKDNPIIVNYQIATSFTEEIPYLESDELEIGVSFQDTTSPSLTIPSEIEISTKVETENILKIKTCGKNLLNEELLKNPDNYIKDETNLGFWKFKILVPKGVSITVSRKDTSELQSYLAADYSVSWNTKVELKWLNHETSGYRDCVTLSAKNNKGEVYLYFSGVFNKIELMLELVGYLQVEVGDTATEYEPYQETAITHELENPLVKCGDIADTIDLVNLKRTNNNYYGILSFTPTKGSLCGNHISCYWNSGNMPKPKIAKNNEDKNQLICDRTIANLRCYASDIGETIAIYKDSSADFIGVFNVNRFKNTTEFKQFFVDNPTMVAYPLATPTTEPLEPELVEKLKQLKTFYPVTHIFSNVPLNFDYKLNLENWHKVVSGQVEDARDVIYNMQVQQNNLEVMQLESSLNMQYNLDLMKLGGNLC